MERLLQYFVPEKYTLDLIIDKFAKTIGGKVVVLGKALRKTVKFHAVGLEITSVLVDGKEADFKAGIQANTACRSVSGWLPIICKI